MIVKSIECKIAVFSLLFASLTLSAQQQSPYAVNMDAVKRAIVFLHRVDDQGKLVEAGTAFLVGVPLKSNPQSMYLVLVTARHITDPQWANCNQTQTVLRAVFNKRVYDPKTDQSGTFSAKVADGWFYPEDDSIDLAAAPLDAQAFTKADLENAPITISQLPTQKELQSIGTGSQIISAGLLLGVSGENRNFPVFKFGNVSTIPNEKLPVGCCPGCAPKRMTEWLIAASLVPGNSGSPIVYVPPLYQGGRPFVLGVQSVSLMGTDVAGMTPISYLNDVLAKMNLPDADLPSSASSQAQTSSAKPDTHPVPAVIPLPK